MTASRMVQWCLSSSKSGCCLRMLLIRWMKLRKLKTLLAFKILSDLIVLASSKYYSRFSYCWSDSSGMLWLFIKY